MSGFLTNMIVMTATTSSLIQPCPSSPNCVSSQATDNHYIKPLAVKGGTKIAFVRLLEILAQRRDTIIGAADEHTIRVEFKTSLGFVDDGLFVLDADNKIIHIRSASRAGYWDFGKNRRRLEEIRKEFRRLLW
jgi:uncharacterized protein (DUF1499 family)